MHADQALIPALSKRLFRIREYLLKKNTVRTNNPHSVFSSSQDLPPCVLFLSDSYRPAAAELCPSAQVPLPDSGSESASGLPFDIEITSNKCVAQILYRDFNAIGEIVIPEEVRNAETAEY